MPAPKDAYGVPDRPSDTKDALPGSVDVYGSSSDLPADRPDVPLADRPPYFPPVDAYGIVPPDVPPYRPVDAPDAAIPDVSPDVKDALPYAVDVYGVSDRPVYKDVLPAPVDAYGMVADRHSDSPVTDAGRDAGDAD
jgi:hypothetical protein